jgi:hypothetical protein
MKRAYKLRARLLQLPHVELCQRRQKALTLRSDAEQNAAMVDGICDATKQTLFDGAIHQLNRAVVFQYHAGGYVRDGGRDPFGHTAHALQHLILLASQAYLLDGNMAEMQKSAKLKAKLGKALQVGHIKFRDGRSGEVARQSGQCAG